MAKRNTVMRRFAVWCTLILCSVALTVSAQDAKKKGGRPGGRQRDGQQQGGGARQRRWDPARMQEMMLKRIKGRLEVNDEEWQAIEPMMKDVFAKRSAQGMGRRGMRRRPGRDQENQEPAEGAALKKVLDDEKSTPEAIQAALTAYRAIQAKQELELKDAQKKLLAVLTARQEAKLVMMGILK
ncbi:MAG: hypothetical protein KAI66_14450 [Lentisphaeria bacterium]|nr:hypothetical protein [Lentisphaeria bacterium]